LFAVLKILRNVADFTFAILSLLMVNLKWRIHLSNRKPFPCLHSFSPVMISKQQSPSKTHQQSPPKSCHRNVILSKKNNLLTSTNEYSIQGFVLVINYGKPSMEKKRKKKKEKKLKIKVALVNRMSGTISKNNETISLLLSFG